MPQLKIDNGRFVTTDAEARSYGETDPEDGFFYNYFTGEAVDKLAAYENTELSPEEINDICFRFSCFLSEMTRNRMSKTNYTLDAMIQAARDAHELDCEDYCYLKKMEVTSDA